MERLQYGDPNDFAAGRPAYSGASFTFSDDRWIFPASEKTIAAKPSYSVLNFSDLPDWLKAPAKAYMAWAWLVQDFSLSTLHYRLGTFNWLARFLRERRLDVTQIAALDRSVAAAFSDYLMDNCSPQNAYGRAGVAEDIGRWLRQQYGLAQTFRPATFARRPPRPKSDMEAVRAEEVIPTIVAEQVLSAVRRRHEELWSEWIDLGKRTHRSELVHLQVLQILLATSLRISQILLMPRSSEIADKPYRESRSGEASGLWIIFRETKTHQGLQERFIPEELAPMVKNALDVALEVTADLAAAAPHLNYVFLTNAARSLRTHGEEISNIASGTFSSWLNGAHDSEGGVVRQGFIHRNQIRYQGYYYTISPHQARHTLATRLYEGGAGFGTVVEQLLHRGEMTGIYTHGRERDMRELREALDGGQVAGGSVATVLLDPDRVWTGEVSDERLEVIKQQGLYIQPTPYGFCTHPAELGPCTQPEACWRGVKNQPCDEAVLLPRGLVQIEEDVELLNRQIMLWTDDVKAGPFLDNIRSVRAHYETLKLLLLGGDDGTSSGSPPSEPPGLLPEARLMRTRFKTRRGGQFPVRKFDPNAKIDGMTAPQRIARVLDDARQSGNVPTIPNIVRLAQVHRRYLLQNYPNLFQELQDIRHVDATREARFEAEWHKVLDADEYPTVIEFSRRCGVDRNTLYKRFPKWAQRIRERWRQGREVVAEHRASQQKEAHLQKVAVTKTARQDRRRKGIEQRLESVWAETAGQGHPVSLLRFTKLAHVGVDTLKERFPDWVDRIRAAWSEAQCATDPTLPTRIERAWTGIEQDGRKVTMVALAERVGYNRKSLERFYPELVARIAAQYDYEDRVRDEIDRVEGVEQSVSVVEFCQRVGIPRMVFMRRYPDYHRQLLEFNERMEAHRG